VRKGRKTSSSKAASGQGGWEAEAVRVGGHRGGRQQGKEDGLTGVRAGGVQKREQVTNIRKECLKNNSDNQICRRVVVKLKTKGWRSQNRTTRNRGEDNTTKTNQNHQTVTSSQVNKVDHGTGKKAITTGQVERVVLNTRQGGRLPRRKQKKKKWGEGDPKNRGTRRGTPGKNVTGKV